MAIKISNTTVIDDSRNLTVVGATFSNTSSITIPVGSTIQRPASPSTGMFRFNSDTLQIEIYNGTGWSSSATGISDGKNYFVSS